MDVGTLIRTVMEENRPMVERALEGLTQEDLDRRPSQECNSVGWLTWHMSRVHDRIISQAMGTEHIWVTEGWHARFGMEPDSSNRGSGATLEDIANFRAPSVEILKGYWDAVEKRSKQYMDSIRGEKWDEIVPSLSGRQTMEKAWYLILIANEVIAHSGQIAYVRGWLSGIGWYRRGS